MDFETTIERQEYLSARGCTILLACPGSGKTTCIVYKLKSITKECEKNHSKGAGVLCLSFTNQACDEIFQRYCEFHGECIKYPHEVCTIDSFVTRYILMPFWYLFAEFKKKPTVINEKEINRAIYYTTNADNEEVMSRKFNSFGSQAHIFKPEDMILTETGYFFRIKNFTKEVSKTKNDDFLDYCRIIWKHKVEKGVLNSTDALWIAKKILENNPDIAISLAQRFPYIIVDEAQDSSKWQFEIFEILHRSGVENLEFIGDLNQSIYEWREARPAVLENLITNGGWNVPKLTENRRSVQRIIDFYSRLKPVGTPSIKSYGVEDKGLLIDIIRYNEGNERSALSIFENNCKQNVLEKKLILARGKSEIIRLSAVKTRLMPWKSNLPYRIIDAQLYFNNNEIKEAVKQLKWVVAELLCGIGNFDAQKEYIELHEKSTIFNVRLLSILSALPSLNSSFSEWYIHTTDLLKEKLELPMPPDFLLKKRINGGTIMLSHPISDHYGKNDTQTVAAQTIHSVKGASVDAVLLFIGDKANSKGIFIKQIPCQPDTLLLNQIEERHRLIYVACSRAKQYLALAVPSTVSEMELATQFRGLDINIVSLES